MHNHKHDLVLPRGPVNWDANLSTTGIGYIAKATCPSNSNHSEHEPRNLWWALQQVAEEYQYFVHKRSPPPKSRRRRRYEERISWLSSRDGRTKRRRKLGQPGTANPSSTVDTKAPRSTFDKAELSVIVLYVPFMALITLITYADHVMAITHSSVSMAYTSTWYLSMLTMLFAAYWLPTLAAHWLSTVVTFVWTVPAFISPVVYHLRVAYDYLALSVEYCVWLTIYLLLCLRYRPIVHDNLHGFCGPCGSELPARPNYLLWRDRRWLALWSHHGCAHDDAGHCDPDALAHPGGHRCQDAVGGAGQAFRRQLR
jgi:hypothetical protein